MHYTQKIAGVICLMFAIGCLTVCAEEPESVLQEHPLVKVQEVIPDVCLGLRYATEDNFAGKKIYKTAECYLRLPVAEALLAAQNELKKLGFEIKIYDGFRPLSAQQILWDYAVDVMKIDPTGFVADPKKGGKHTRGTAVDLTIIDAETREELVMPTEFDDPTEKAWRSNMDLPDDVIANRKLLQDVMESNGFTGLPTEWWHFDFNGWEQFEVIRDIDFCDL